MHGLGQTHSFQNRTQFLTIYRDMANIIMVMVIIIIIIITTTTTSGTATLLELWSVFYREIYYFFLDIFKITCNFIPI
jgi:uncharacterized membrane-anchored protein